MALKAFTLVETMVVVGIVGVVAAIGVQQVSALIETRSSRIQVERVVTTLGEARDAARERRRCAKVTAPTTASFQIDSLAIATDGSCTTTVESSQTVTFTPKYITLDVTLDVEFDRTGARTTSSSSDTQDISVIETFNTRSVTHTVRIYKTLGLIRKIS